MRWWIAFLLLVLVACGSAPTEVAAVKRSAKDEAKRQVAEAEAFALDAQRQIDQAEAAVREAERVIAEQKAQAEAAARHAAAARASRSRTTAPKPAPRVVGGDVWARLAACESGGNPRAVGGGGRFYGAFQFMLSTWRSVGMSGNPIDHPYEVQLQAAQRLQARSGWGQWPHCARKLGLI